jgi:hypothetical protein
MAATNGGRSEFWRHLNTALITLGIGISSLLLIQATYIRSDQKRMELEFAVANQILIDHLDDSEMWIDIIRDLADQKHPATSSRYTKLDAVKDKDILRKEVYQYLEKNYKRKE